jgi:hypothetical protein
MDWPIFFQMLGSVPWWGWVGLYLALTLVSVCVNGIKDRKLAREEARFRRENPEEWRHVQMVLMERKRLAAEQEAVQRREQREREREEQRAEAERKREEERRERERRERTTGMILGIGRAIGLW